MRGGGARPGGGRSGTAVGVQLGGIGIIRAVPTEHGRTDVPSSGAAWPSSERALLGAYRSRCTINVFGEVCPRRRSWYDTFGKTIVLGTCRGSTEQTALHPAGTVTGSGPRASWTLDAASVFDLVAHEAAHAVIHTLKPGWGGGATSIIGEGVADTVAFLVSAEDWDVTDAVAAETGGDYTRQNEVSRLCESEIAWSGGPARTGPSYLRSALCSEILQDYELSARDEAPNLGAWEGPGRPEPHAVGSVLCGALYDWFAWVSAEGLQSGLGLRSATARAATAVGTTLMRALIFAGEHRVSLAAFSRALLRSEVSIHGGRHQEHLRQALLARQLLDEASYAPTGPAPAAVTEHVYPYNELDPIRDLRLQADLRAPDGTRCIRVAFSTNRLVPLAPNTIESTNPGIVPGDLVARTFDVYCSLVFNAAGESIDIFADRPWDDDTTHTPVEHR